MTSAGIIFAIITVLAWGTWLAPSQKVKMQGQQTRTFYVTLAVMLLAVIAALFTGTDGLNSTTFWFPFLGGLIWSLSGWSAFIGTNRLGMAKAFGIWAPMNIVVSILWGIVLFGEFLDINKSGLILTVLSFLLILSGILIIIFSEGNKDRNRKTSVSGLLGAMGAGVGFASYFIPIQIGTANYPEFTMWIGTLPLSVGMFAGSSILMVVSKSSPKLEKASDYSKVLSTGLLWAIGNYGALAMMEAMGTGRGFTIAQLCVVVNALVGVYILKEPRPGTRAARLTLIGVFIAMAGAILLGNIR